MANSIKLCHKHKMGVKLAEGMEMDEHLSETNCLQIGDFLCAPTN